MRRLFLDQVRFVGPGNGDRGSGNAVRARGTAK